MLLLQSYSGSSSCLPLTTAYCAIVCAQVDAWVPQYIAVCLTRLVRTERRVLKDALVCTVANALYYNPVLALNALVSAGALGQFFQVRMAAGIVNIMLPLWNPSMIACEF